MNQLTPPQQQMIKTWTEQRDALLLEIGNYSTELNTIKETNKQEGFAYADLQKSIAEARGRLAELDALETRMRTSVATDVSELQVRKSRLEGECAVLEEKLKTGTEKYEFITKAADELEAAHTRMKDQAQIVKSVVGEIIEVSNTHTSDMKVIMSEVKALSDEVIEKSNKNIAQADIVLNKLTMHVIDRQRPIPVRRTYPEGHPKYEKNK